MKKIFVIGSTGQIGSELTMKLRKIYGGANVVAGYIPSAPPKGELLESGPAEVADITNAQELANIVKKYNIDTVYNLAALLSAVAEAKPQLAWQVGMGGLFNLLEVSREYNCAAFTPSSIAAFGPGTPMDNTPQDTLQRPKTMYGVTKVAGELLCDYYFERFGVDTRSVRFPGLISNVTLPGGGTTDYAVEIFYSAVKEKHFTCPLTAGTYMDMMYMPDAIDAAINLMEADASKLKHRNSFNITAMSFDPEELATEIRKHIPEFTMDYKIDEVRQKIANSWPNSMDDSCARAEWGWNPKYDLTAMATDMIAVLSKKYEQALI